MKKIVIATTLSALLAAPAFAENGFYAGGSIGQSNTSSPNGYSLSSNTDTVIGGIVGYQVNSNFAVEGEYTGAGKFSGPSLNGKSDVITVEAVGILPLANRFSLYGKLGAGIANTTLSTAPGGVSGTNRTAIAYGLGGQYRVMPKLDLRLGLDSYGSGINTPGTTDYRATVVSVGALYHF